MKARLVAWSKKVRPIAGELDKTLRAGRISAPLPESPPEMTPPFDGSLSTKCAQNESPSKQPGKTARQNHPAKPSGLSKQTVSGDQAAMWPCHAKPHPIWQAHVLYASRPDHLKDKVVLCGFIAEYWLTCCELGSYKALTNEGGALLARRSLPLFLFSREPRKRHSDRRELHLIRP